MNITINQSDFDLGYFDERIKYDAEYARQKVEEGITDDLIHDLFLEYYEHESAHRGTLKTTSPSRLKKQMCKNPEKFWEYIMEDLDTVDEEFYEDDEDIVEQRQRRSIFRFRNNDYYEDDEYYDDEEYDDKNDYDDGYCEEDDYYFDELDDENYDDAFAREEPYKKTMVIYNMYAGKERPKEKNDDIVFKEPLKDENGNTVKIPDAPIEMAVKAPTKKEIEEKNKKKKLMQEKLRAEMNKAKAVSDIKQDTPTKDAGLSDSAKAEDKEKMQGNGRQETQTDEMVQPANNFFESTQSEQKDIARKELLTQIALENKINDSKLEKASKKKNKDGLLVLIKQLECKIVGE